MKTVKNNTKSVDEFMDILDRPSFVPLEQGVHQVRILEWDTNQVTTEGEKYGLLKIAPVSQLEHVQNVRIFKNTIQNLINNLQRQLNMPGVPGKELLATHAIGKEMPATLKIVNKPDKTGQMQTYINWYVGYAMPEEKLNGTAQPATKSSEKAAPKRKVRP